MKTSARVQLACAVFLVFVFFFCFFFTSCGGGGSNQNINGNQNPPISISITSQILTVNPGEVTTILARVTNTDNIAVSWSVSCAPGVSDCGSIRVSTDVSSPGVAYGLYTAPAVAVSSS